MEKQADRYSEETDLGTFLGYMAKKLTKEGDSLRALAEDWFQHKTDEQTVLVAFGVEMGKIGRQLLDLRQQLCNTCQTKVVSEVLSFAGGSKLNGSNGLNKKTNSE